MKRFTYYRLLTIILGVSLAISCRDSAPDSKSPTISERTAEINPLASVAPEFYKKIENPYERLGKGVYNHFKLNAGTDPIDYIAKPLREKYLKALDEDRKKFAGMSLDQRLTLMKNSNEISPTEHKLVKDYFDELGKTMDQASSASEIWNYLDKYENNLDSKNDHEAKQVLLFTSSLIRNYVKYKWEVDEFSAKAADKNYHFGTLSSLRNKNTRTAEFCLLGLKGSCWLSNLGSAVFSGLTVGLTAGSASNSSNNKNFFQNASSTGYGAAIFSFIKSTVQSYTGSSCGCGASSVVACERPYGFQLLIDGCSLTQSFQVMGGGAAPGSYTFTVANGTLPEYGNVHSISNVSAKAIKITQTDQNNPVTVDVIVNCTDGTSTTFYSNTFDLYLYSRSPGTPYIYGGTNIDYNDPSNWTYNVSSNDVFSSTNNTYVWSRNFAGTTVSGGANNTSYIVVDWTYRTPGYPKGAVYLQSINSCSSQEYVASLSVNIY